MSLNLARNILTFIELMSQTTDSSGQECLHICYVLLVFIFSYQRYIYTSIWFIPHQCTLWEEVLLLTPENTQGKKHIRLSNVLL